ncbi:MAG: hypothetical protein V3R84_06605, partial [Acidimicrobiia bacterium]
MTLARKAAAVLFPLALIMAACAGQIDTEGDGVGAIVAATSAATTTAPLATAPATTTTAPTTTTTEVPVTTRPAPPPELGLVVEEMIAAYNTGSVDDYLSFFAPDADVYGMGTPGDEAVKMGVASGMLTLQERHGWTALDGCDREYLT